MALKVHPDQYGVECGVDPRKLRQLSRLVARLTGFKPQANKPVVGDGLFVTESGVHQDGLLKDPASYLPFLPEEVGAEPVHLVLGKHSGRRAVRYRVEQLGLSLSDEQVQQVVEHLKRRPARSVYTSEDDLRALAAEVFPEGLQPSQRG